MRFSSKRAIGRISSRAGKASNCEHLFQQQPQEKSAYMAYDIYPLGLFRCPRFSVFPLFCSLKFIRHFPGTSAIPPRFYPLRRVRNGVSCEENVF